MKLHQDYKEFIELLNANEVEYLVIGAFALGFHGHPRFTGDIDFWVRNDLSNAEKVFKSIKEFGFPMSKLKTEDFTSDDFIFQMGFPPIRIDIITSVDGLEFDKSFKNKNEKLIEGLKINFINIEDFITNKKRVGRNKDLADLEGLDII
jgi:predicted nucleotidyltransferase